MKETVAAFDFDGTISKFDVLLPFLIFLDGPLKAAGRIFLKIPILLGYLLGLFSRQETKEAILTPFIAGKSLDELQKKGRAFSKGPLKKLIRQKALQKIQWHQSQGHRCVVISATLDIFLKPWADEMKFNDLICSKIETDGEGKATGKLEGANCWGPEKTRRLLELLGSKNRFELYAYGDSRGDRELLELADYPFYKKWD